jgi:hypothetical protein
LGSSRGRQRHLGRRLDASLRLLAAGTDRNAIEHLKQRAPLRFTSSGDQQRAFLSSTTASILAERRTAGIPHRRIASQFRKAERNQLHPKPGNPAAICGRLIEQLKVSDDEIVMRHEIGHALANHRKD